MTLLVHLRISDVLDRIPLYTTQRHYDVIVGLLVHGSQPGQGKKGDCVGKKMNGGPVHITENKLLTTIQ